jgi:hypothetical protein
MAVTPVPGRRGPRLREVATQAAVVAVGTAVAVVAAVPDLDRYVVVLAVLTVVAAVAAAVLPWRMTGTVTVLAATLTVLLAGTLDPSSLRPVQAVLAAALLMLLVAVLGAREDRSGQSPHAASVALRSAPARAVAPALALGAGSLVALTAAQDVVPSVPLVLAGLAAAVVALVVAAGAHRR